MGLIYFEHIIQNWISLVYLFCLFACKKYKWWQNHYVNELKKCWPIRSFCRFCAVQQHYRSLVQSRRGAFTSLLNSGQARMARILYLEQFYLGKKKKKVFKQYIHINDIFYLKMFSQLPWFLILHLAINK